MEEIRAYILSVIAAAVLCTIIQRLMGEKSAYKEIIRLVSGIFLAVTVVSPFAKLQIRDFSDYLDGIELEANSAAAIGEESLKDGLNAIIKEKSEAYILDKATSMGLDLRVEVTLDDSETPVPSAVTVTGNVSPYQKRKLKQIIADEIGVQEDNQTWR